MNIIHKLHLDNQGRSRAPVNLSVNAGEASIYLYDVISADWGIGALSVMEQIAQIDSATVLNIYINSPGGDVFEARAIMAALSRFDGKTVAHVDSLCASAATSVALACDSIEMSDGALWMIHNASGAVWGDKTAMRDTADLLQKVEVAIVDDYAKKTGMPRADIMALMDAETWMTAKEALDLGFIDRIKPMREKPANTWNLSAYAKAPTVPAQAPEQAAAPVQPALTSPSPTASNHNRLRLAQIL